jgi:uncharacterized protein (DUF362 family)/Pyruvate/2-oxoacid:ferredoxin oxidoreductase delta subunit
LAVTFSSDLTLAFGRTFDYNTGLQSMKQQLRSEDSKGLSIRRARVAVVRCPSYSAESLSAAVGRSLELSGGPGELWKAGTKVFAKINHLSPQAPPDRAICTHPHFVREVLRALLERGAQVTVGDDVNFGQGDEFLTTGFRQVCDELNVPLVNLRECGFERVSLRGEMLTSTYVAKPVLEADLVLNLPKLKTHSFTAFTGAVKNMYGVIPYGLRLDGHHRFLRNDQFSRMLVDIFSSIPRQFTIMDAVVGMEREGPSSGVPREIGLIIAGWDGVAVDAVASAIAGYFPLDIFTTADAHARGLGVGDLRQIEVLGEKVADVRLRHFRPSLAATALFRRWLPSFLYGFVSSQLVLTPEIRRASCTACLDCVRICPARTISLVREKALVDEAGCIHCLCCHEVCPARSIRLKQRPLGRLFRGGGRLLDSLQKLH